MDIAPSHAIPKLSNVKAHFLPPITTSHRQPLDAGIIQNFKSHYRKKQLAHLADFIDKKEPPIQDELDLDPDLRLTVRQFVDLDKLLAPSEMVEEGEIVNSVTTNTSDDPDGDDDETDIYLASPPFVAEAKLAIDTVVNSLEHEKLTTESDVKKCFELNN
ncbi:uncharacterized protein [Argopecten irradians]|uniref:uncharacterized protein n=1 Tax=Argopecten irradians TaxID=31199 RepID=UPI0037144B09